MDRSIICILVVYFGNWLTGWRFFLDGCLRNHFIDFLFVGNSPPTELEEFPSNCRFLHMSLKDLNSRASKITGLSIALSQPYKVCDLRPAFGEIFAEELCGYTFWGSSDMDLLYGDLQSFLTPERLKKYDAFFIRKQYTTGSLFLLRNSENINSLYKKSPDYKHIFQDPNHNYVFDECAGAWKQLIGGASIKEVHTPTISFTQVVKDAEEDGLILPLFDDMAIEYIPRKCNIILKNGHLYHDKNEYLLFHYVINKSSIFFTFPYWKKIPSSFSVAPCGVFHLNEVHGKLWVIFHRFKQVLNSSRKKLFKLNQLFFSGRGNALWHHVLILASRYTQKRK